MEPLKFHLITDTHYYNYGQRGFSDHKDQVVVNESGAVLDAVFDWLLEQNDTDIVLIAGDLCTTGHRADSEGFLPMLRRLQAGGKRVFAITASHDYYRFDHAGEDSPHPDMLYREDLFALYRAFGPDQALSLCPSDPLSYCAQLAPGYRLLCLNTDNGCERDLSGLYDWAEDQVRLAREEGEYLFAMHHYPVLPPSPAYTLLSGHIFRNSAGVRERLADAGLRFVFTGHTHMQNISEYTTPAGSRLYDINTGAAVGYDAPIRTVVFDAQQVTITTSSIEDFAWDRGGKSVSEYLKDGFDAMLGSIFEAMNTDIALMLDILGAEFHVNKEAFLKHRRLLALGGKFLYRLTLGGAGRLLCCGAKIPKGVRQVRVKDLMMEMVRNVYTGDEPYSRQTEIGAAMFALTGRLEALLRPVLKKQPLPFESLQGFVMSLLYDGGLPDNAAVLPLV